MPVTLTTPSPDNSAAGLRPWNLGRLIGHIRSYAFGSLTPKEG